MFEMHACTCTLTSISFQEILKSGRKSINPVTQVCMRTEILSMRFRAVFLIEDYLTCIYRQAAAASARSGDVGGHDATVGRR